MHTCLEIDLELKIDYILFQEPYINMTTKMTISHSAYYCIMPESEEVRPRVMIFAKKSSRFQFCQRSDICSDTDILIIDINDSLNAKAEVIQLINIYNKKSLAENSNEWTVKRSLKDVIPHANTIICGDFNSHYSWWNLAVLDAEARKATILVNWLQQFQFDLISESDSGTFHRNNLVRNSNIDLVFSTSNISQYISWWKDEEYTIGLKHDMIFFSISKKNDILIENPLYAYQYNFEKVDWKKINEEILLKQNNEKYQ